MSPDPQDDLRADIVGPIEALLYGPTTFCNVYKARCTAYSYRTEDGNEYKYTDLPSLNNEGYILLRQHYISDRSILGDFWTQSIVRVKVGVIRENSQYLVTFEFTCEPYVRSEVQIFLGQDVIDTFYVPPSNNWVKRRKAVLLTGDGETSIDLFLRPIYQDY